MFFEARTFWLAKDAQEAAQYQDAFSVDPVRGVAAIADGVSSSLFSGLWAKLLTDAVAANPPNADDKEAFAPWLSELRRQWVASIDADNLAWHQKAKIQQGAHATLLWLQIQPNISRFTGRQDGFHLHARAVGDSVLFHARGSQMLRAFPIEHSQLLDEDPMVLGSVPHQGDAALKFAALEDECDEGDLLVLCTDAIAAWALKQLEAGQTLLWRSFWDMSQEEWSAYIGRLREDQRMRYDDATLVLLRVSSGQATAASRNEQANWVDDARRGVDGAAETVKNALNWFGGKK